MFPVANEATALPLWLVLQSNNKGCERTKIKSTVVWFQIRPYNEYI